MTKKRDHHHTANFTVSSFLMSKRSIKKIYDLNPSKIGILRYICDSIDIYSVRHKQLKTKLYQKQIAKYTHTTPKTIRRLIESLVKKRLITYNPETHIFMLGKILTGWVKMTYGIDMGQNDPRHRYGSKLPTSNSSNFTNRSENVFVTEKPKSEKRNAPIQIGSVASPLLEEFMAKKK